MQEVSVEPGRRPAQQPHHQFAGVDLRRPKGYATAPVQEATPAVKVAEGGDPCPRCASRDTKFCYYNNYNTSQPRHFCKGCRRYWTKGGTLRNVPVGGGTRKKPSSSSYAAAAAAAADADNKPPKKKPASKKRRVEAPVPEPAAAADASGVTDTVAAADSAKTTTTTTTTTTDGASEITTETEAAVAVAVPVAEEDSESLAHLLLQPGAEEAVSLGLGLSDFPSAAGKAVLDDDSFVWPAAFDLGTCWASAGFADTDPASLFLNLP
ncbi:hypothetical protein BDA96_07G237900 [Sorghum bicolor]|jgi:hypothetical protein|nr:hypothetical protein BDA96_07G237900 [Sorghum bicolor]OQU81009.1 hypothetical protein SORBI_3007G223200 [Sorghum bicolor]